MRVTSLLLGAVVLGVNRASGSIRGRWPWPSRRRCTTRRRSLIDHEFGHGLGHAHEDCARPGALAPVMMQAKGTGGCEANGWPYPEVSPPVIGLRVRTRRPHPAGTDQV
jgi:hypothetical protein